MLENDLKNDIDTKTKKLQQIIDLYNQKKSNLLNIVNNLIQVTNKLSEEEASSFFSNVESLKKSFEDLELILSYSESMITSLNNAYTLFKLDPDKNKDSVEGIFNSFDKQSQKLFESILSFESNFSNIINSTLELALAFQAKSETVGTAEKAAANKTFETAAVDGTFETVGENGTADTSNEAKASIKSEALNKADTLNNFEPSEEAEVSNKAKALNEAEVSNEAKASNVEQINKNIGSSSNANNTSPVYKVINTDAVSSQNNTADMETPMFKNEILSPNFGNNSSETTEEVIENQDELQKKPFVEEDKNILLISEKENKAYLPYKIEQVKSILNSHKNKYSSMQDVVNNVFVVPLDKFKNSSISRFRESYNLMRTKEKASVLKSLDLGMELMFENDLNPVVITACNSLSELDSYMDCLDENNLADFKCFDIKFEVNPKPTKK